MLGRRSPWAGASFGYEWARNKVTDGGDVRKFGSQRRDNPFQGCEDSFIPLLDIRRLGAMMENFTIMRHDGRFYMRTAEIDTKNHR